MAHLHVDFFSQTLQVGSSLEVIMPEEASGAIGLETTSSSEPPVLYLLHGLSDDHTIWMRRTSIERYAAEYGLAVVMPGVGRSWYTDMASGPAYWQYVSEEVPRFVERTFRVGTGRAKTFVAGLSMGGYGAMKMAFLQPGRFAAAASFSGAVDMRERVAEVRARTEAAAEQPLGNDEIFRIRDTQFVFGDPPVVAGTDNDTFLLAERVAGSRVAGSPAAGSRETPHSPELYIACGTEDFLYEHNERFHRHLTELGLEHTYITEPGTHEWGFWDRHVAAYLGWLREKRLL